MTKLNLISFFIQICLDYALCFLYSRFLMKIFLVYSMYLVDTYIIWSNVLHCLNYRVKGIIEDHFRLFKSFDFMIIILGVAILFIFFPRYFKLTFAPLYLVRPSLDAGIWLRPPPILNAECPPGGNLYNLFIFVIQNTT